MSTKLKTLLALSSSALILAACQGQDAGESSGGSSVDSSEETTDSNQSSEGVDYKVAIVTDEGGVDDRSFNQSAWEGLQEWSEETGGKSEYYQSNDSSDFMPNLNTALSDGYDIIYGIGYLLEDALAQVAQQNPDQQFGTVDSLVEEDNVVSLNFSDHEAAFLAGVAAATETQNDHVGFIGGIKGVIIDRFETGFNAGVEYVDSNIKVDNDYAESFGDAALGQQIASAMYTNGADIVYHAAGAVGNGVFTEARNRKESNPDQEIWVIGVDRDQEEEGNWSGGNLTLTSSLKNVGTAMQLATEEAREGNFPGGENKQYDLKEDGVGLTEGNLSEEAIQAVNEAKEKIINGEIEVPEFTYTTVE